MSVINVDENNDNLHEILLIKSALDVLKLLKRGIGNFRLGFHLPR